MGIKVIGTNEIIGSLEGLKSILGHSRFLVVGNAAMVVASIFNSLPPKYPHVKVQITSKDWSFLISKGYTVTQRGGNKGKYIQLPDSLIRCIRGHGNGKWKGTPQFFHYGGFKIKGKYVPSTENYVIGHDSIACLGANMVDTSALRSTLTAMTHVLYSTPRNKLIPTGNLARQVAINNHGEILMFDGGREKIRLTANKDIYVTREFMTRHKWVESVIQTMGEVTGVLSGTWKTGPQVVGDEAWTAYTAALAKFDQLLGGNGELHNRAMQCSIERIQYPEGYYLSLGGRRVMLFADGIISLTDAESFSQDPDTYKWINNVALTLGRMEDRPEERIPVQLRTEHAGLLESMLLATTEHANIHGERVVMSVADGIVVPISYTGFTGNVLNIGKATFVPSEGKIFFQYHSAHGDPIGSFSIARTECGNVVYTFMDGRESVLTLMQLSSSQGGALKLVTEIREGRNILYPTPVHIKQGFADRLRDRLPTKPPKEKEEPIMQEDAKQKWQGFLDRLTEVNAHLDPSVVAELFSAASGLNIAVVEAFQAEAVKAKREPIDAALTNLANQLAHVVRTLCLVENDVPVALRASAMRYTHQNLVIEVKLDSWVSFHVCGDRWVYDLTKGTHSAKDTFYKDFQESGLNLEQAAGGIIHRATIVATAEKLCWTHRNTPGIDGTGRGLIYEWVNEAIGNPRQTERSFEQWIFAKLLAK